MLKSDFRILLISFYNGEALGLRQLHAILHQNGYDSKMLFVKLSPQKIIEDQKNKLIGTFTNESNVFTRTEEDLLVKFLAEYKPDLLGFSLVSSNFGLYKRIYERIRGTGKFKTVLGGWQVSLNPEQCLDHTDFLCVGEAEETLPELADCLFTGASPEDVANLWMKKDGRIIRNPVRPLVSELDNYPLPVFSDEQSYYLENDQLYHKEPYMFNSRYGIMAGRGCPYKCTYCSNSFMADAVYQKSWLKIRHRSVEHVMNELLRVREKLPNITRVNFYDEVFLPQKRWAEKFFPRYVKEIGLPFYCMFFPGTCNDELAKLLKDSLLDGVWLGVQSGSERVRREIFKRFYTNESILKQADIFKKNNINVRYDFILDNPFESFAESLESLNLLLELPEPFSLNLFSLKFFPNTEITRMALKKNFIKQDDLDDQSKSDHHNYLISATDKNDDNNFINHTAMYISLLAVKKRVQKEKPEILKLMSRYATSRNISEIKELTARELSARQ